MQKPLSGEAQPKKSRKKLKTSNYILFIALLIGLGAAAATMFFGSSDKAVEISTEPVITKTITQLVSATGKIQPETEVIISPDVSGEITSLPVKEGQYVQKGDLLFRIDPELLEAQVEQQQASLSAAKAKSLQAKAQLLLAEDEFRRTKELFSKKLISESEYLTSKTNADVTQATYQASLFDINRVESLLKQSRDQFSRSTIYAPMNGTITRLNNKLGERVVGTSQFAGTEVLKLADLSRMEIIVEVNENDIVNVKLADTSRIYVDAYPNRTFMGIVTEIASTAATSAEGTQEEVTNFDVTVRILNHAQLLRPGMSATADIETATVHSAIAVPIQSVTVRSPSQTAKNKDESGKTRKDDNDTKVINQQEQAAAKQRLKDELMKVVFIKTGEKAEMRRVETGIADNTHIEILAGVEPGEEVISGSYRAISRELFDGTAIKLPEESRMKND